ncbi:MAG: 23S rRNA (uracil(1939)-C(5))-methyltransferase RlmD [Candidatus Diapherotrites archaeon]
MLSTPIEEKTYSMCPHRDECNGCPRMGVSYSVQEKEKKERVEKALQYYVENAGWVPSNSLQFYRNRADFFFDQSKTLGFRRKGGHFQSFNVPSCQLLSPASQKLYAYLATTLSHAEWATYYSVLKQKGYLRYVVIRESKNPSSRIAIFLTFTTEDATEMNALAETLLHEKLADGIVWIHHSAFNDSFGGTIFQTWGNPLLTEKINGISFTYNAKCFFQTNPKMAEKIQHHITQLVPTKNKVLDLYCGVGLFSIPLAMRGNVVKGVELTPESITYAQKNAHAHQITEQHCTFIEGNVPKYLQEMEKQKEQWNTIILDPPRSGLSKKIIRRILRLNPTQLVYVSCNLSALIRDLEWLEEYAEYKITNATAFDLFPHTEHVETVVDIQIQKINEYPKGGF